VTIKVERFDLTGQRALVIGNVAPVINALADTYTGVGAMVTTIECRAADIGRRLPAAIATHDSLDTLVSAFDLFFAKPITEVTADELGAVMMANCASQFMVCQHAVVAMRQQHHGGRIVLVTNVLGERGVPNTSVYAAAHGAVHNLIRALAQEVAPFAITVNGIALGWMDWMHDRLDPADQEAARALRFPIIKRAGCAADIGALAVWLSGAGAGYVTGQIFPVDGGLTQHL
jgi:NAD(P)-dependent dehydrogenase (short-subunit alcohol dehydrogenase family)